MTAAEVSPKGSVLITRQTQALDFMSPFPFKRHLNPLTWTKGYLFCTVIQNRDLELEHSKLLHKIILDSSCSISGFLLLCVSLLTLTALTQVIYYSEGREKDKVAFQTGA